MKKILGNVSKIYNIVHDKSIMDEKQGWCKGSKTFFVEIQKELLEVEEVLYKNKKCYLEDELGDVFWDYLNLLKNLESEKMIEMEKVFERCAQKYSQRITNCKNGIDWDETKNTQKEVLKKEQQKFDLTTESKISEKNII